MKPNPLSIKRRAIVPVGITPSPPVPNPQGYPKGTQPVTGACDYTRAVRTRGRPSLVPTQDELEIRASLGSYRPEVKKPATFRPLRRRLRRPRRNPHRPRRSRRPRLRRGPRPDRQDRNRPRQDAGSLAGFAFSRL